jgi:hypothetical protein
MFREFPQVRIAQNSKEFLDDIHYFTDQVRGNSVIPRRQLPETYLWRTKADKIVKAILQTQKTQAN